MPSPAPDNGATHTGLIQRGGWLAAATLTGALACAALLLALGGPVRLALAAPEAPTATRTFPGAAPCNTTLQACVDGANAGDTIDIQPNTYVTSVTLSKAVSLTGVSSATVVLQALAGQRVLTVTGAAVNSSVVISGLTFRNGNAVGAGCPAGCGGAILITGTASPLVQNVTISNSVAQHQGGGLYAGAGSAVQLIAVNVLSNTSGSDGGGVRTNGPTTVTGGLFWHNRCLNLNCGAGGLEAGGGLSLSNASFISNTTQSGASGAYAAQAASVSGGLFQDNRCLDATCMGAGLYANGSLTMIGTQFLSNTSVYAGGALFANSTAQLSGVLFRNNQCTDAACSGGAVQALTLVVTTTQFISNSSQAEGGAASAQTLSALNSVMQDNRCVASGCAGGAVDTSQGLALTNTQVLSNTAAGDGGALHTDGPVALSGGLLQNNRCTAAGCQGGAVYAGNGLTVNATQLISNSSQADGAGIFAVGPATVTGALFQRNHCDGGSCGAGGLLATGVAQVSETNFISNTAQYSAGGLFLSKPGSVSGGLFQDNHCLESNCVGGALYTNDTVAVTGTQFLSNSATHRGGAVFTSLAVTYTEALLRGNRCTDAACNGGAIFALESLVLNDSQLISNMAAAGGAWLASGPATLIDTTIADNTTADNGGGGYAVGTVSVSGGVFANNRCTDNPCYGGGLYANGAATISGTQFLSNTSRFDGGGLYANGVLTLTNSVVQGNACTVTFCFAGGVLANGAAAVTGSRFVDNSSQSHGGGLYALGTLNVSASEFHGNVSGEGGALALSGPAGQIVNSLFAGNTARSGHGAAAALIATGTVTLLHNTLVSATLGGGSAVFVVQATARLTNTLVAGYAFGLEQQSGSLLEDYTLFAGVGAPYSGTVSGGAHSLTGTADFVDAAGGDFHLGAASDAIDAGATAGVLVDFDGQPRPVGPAPDIGFDEFLARLFLLPMLR